MAFDSRRIEINLRKNPMATFRSIEKNKVNYFQVAWQACAMFTLSILLGFAINQLRSDRLPLAEDGSIKTIQSK